MSSQSGTLEGLLQQATILLSPLTSLTPAGAQTLLADLGLPVTQTGVNQIAPALTKTTEAISSLIDLAFEIENAVSQEEWGKVIEKGVAAIDQVAQLISGFSQLKTALNGLNIPNAGSIVSNLPVRLLNYLLAQYLGRSPGVNEVLQLTGILERTDHNVGSIDPAKPFYTSDEFHFDRIGGWMTDPKGQLEELYDWGKGNFDGKKLFALIDRLIGEFGLPIIYEPSASPPRLDVVFAELTARTNVNPRGFAIRLKQSISNGSIELSGNHWTLSLALDAKLPGDTEILFQPGKITFKPPDSTKISATPKATYSYIRDTDDPLLLLSIAGGSKVSVEEVSASIGFTITGSGKTDLELGADLKRGKVLITMENADGFLGTILGGFKVENNFDLGVGFSMEEGVHFHGSSALEIQLASHIDLGPVSLDALTLSIGIKDGAFPVGISTDIKATLGVLEAVVSGIGFELIFSLADGNSGNLGPLDLSAGFKPPKGVGLKVDAGVVKGGGYLLFDTEREEYGGALELDIVNLVSAKAIGVVTTRMPDGSKGFSLIIIISVEFSPAFQLGYGFTLNGVGGLLGLNRTVDLEKLREGVRTNSIDNIMFPSDVIGNAPQIISDLRTIFPPQTDVFLIGPMAKLGWGTPTLISLAFGLIIEIPGNIAILGVLKLVLPTEDADLIRIQVNFVGTLDFDKGMLTFDASLYDSHILFLTIEGDMAVRFKWSDPAGFLISIGGFHPSYQPPAELEVLPMKRLAVNILNTDWARIRVEVYFAVTSNSFQTGARAEIYFGFDAFYVDGYLGFDALFRFSPFYFEIGISAGVTLHVFGADLLSIRLQFSLSGPSPWHAWGAGSVTILFWDITADFDITWGDSEPTTLPPVDVLPMLLDDLNKPAHWKALQPDHAHLWVSLRAIGGADTTLVLHPAGQLSVFQKVAPLEFTWSRIGTQKPADIDRAALSSAKSGSVVLTLSAINDQFARSQYEDLSDSQKLSVPSFEPMHAGVTIGLGKQAQGGNPVERTISYETIVIDKERAQPFRLAAIAGLHTTLLAGGAMRRSAFSRAHKRRFDPFPNEKIDAHGETYTVASTDNNRPHSAQASFTSEAMARDYMVRQTAAQPNLKGQLHVIPASEVNLS